MSFGFNGGCGYDNNYGNYGNTNTNYNNDNSIARFLRTLSPGTPVVLQYDDRRPARGIFEGFQNGNVLLSNFNGFPGLVRIAANKVNAVAPAGFCHDCHE